MLEKIIIVTFIFEATTILFRWAFGSIKENLVKLKIKPRIHHGYFGLSLIVFWFFFKNDHLLVLGMSLFLSDVAHHFIVLPIWIGKTEF